MEPFPVVLASLLEVVALKSYLGGLSKVLLTEEEVSQPEHLVPFPRFEEEVLTQ